MHAFRDTRGFTLVELLIVVVVLGILAAMAIPSLGDITTDAKRSAFASDLRILAESANRYNVQNNQHLPDTSSGVWPSEWAGSIPQNQFEAQTPLGGVWDIELNSFGVVAAIGAHFGADIPSDADLSAVDAIMDDGNLGTGVVRKLAADRFYYVLEE